MFVFKFISYISSTDLPASTSTKHLTLAIQDKLAQIGMSLPLDPTREFYPLIDGKYHIFFMKDEMSTIQKNLTKRGFVTAIQHLTEIIRNQQVKQCDIVILLGLAAPRLC